MAFREFEYPGVQQLLGLTLAEADLFAAIPALDLPAEFLERMRLGIDLGLAVNTEKARSELIIAPVLMELRRILGGRFGLFSGVEFDVDASRGLNGFCDFILTRSPLQSVLTAPVVAIAEANASVSSIIVVSLAASSPILFIMVPEAPIETTIRPGIP